MGSGSIGIDWQVGAEVFELNSVPWFVVDLRGGCFNLLLYFWKLSALVVS